MEDQLQWLVDRAEISDLLIEFARSLDEKDWGAHTALYAPDGVFTAGDALRLEGHTELRHIASPQGLGPRGVARRRSAAGCVQCGSQLGRGRLNRRGGVGADAA